MEELRREYEFNPEGVDSVRAHSNEEGGHSLWRIDALEVRPIKSMDMNGAFAKEDVDKGVVVAAVCVRAATQQEMEVVDLA